eukprot:scaffold82798_cov33-Tisochrysis_lutea.AAC.1
MNLEGTNSECAPRMPAIVNALTSPKCPNVPSQIALQQQHLAPVGIHAVRPAVTVCSPTLARKSVMLFRNSALEGMPCPPGCVKYDGLANDVASASVACVLTKVSFSPITCRVGKEMGGWEAARDSIRPSREASRGMNPDTRIAHRNGGGVAAVGVDRSMNIAASVAPCAPVNEEDLSSMLAILAD